MTDDSSRKAPLFRGLAHLFRRGGTPPSPPPGIPAPDAEAGSPAGVQPATIGHYAIIGQLGRGGMGIVYRARDSRLQRAVAIKTIAKPAVDESARLRFWREARAAASVNHPNICQIYDIGEHEGELYLAMELLEGESLADRLRDGPLTVSETIPIGLGILAALSALHARAIVHRDLKPSNVFLTPHGVKLLDFGLARPIPQELSGASIGNVTRTGMLVGTPRYIAPEQITGEAADGRADLFATGAILFEMLAGRPAFTGNNAVEILHATLTEQPPALTGSPAVAAVHRVIHRALAKRPSERPPTADAMAKELRDIRSAQEDDTRAMARTLTRLVVLPFRVLRPDPETDFLAFSLPDAIATSLSRFGSLIVRSTTAAARFGGDAPDLKALAAEAEVDRVVMGTLLRSGDQLRATAQLVEASSGTLLTSQTVTSSLGDLFRLQDDIARTVVDALALPLGGSPSTPDAPRNAQAYALYLQANALARNYAQLGEARDLYRQCVELDPGYAPAWAQLGRALRVIGKFSGGPPDSWERAEEALRRALELNPRLSFAHKYYAHLESDTGHSLAALVRLLDEAGRHSNDPELFAGLVHACRYCGLYDQSIAAHEEARRLDPNVPTSLPQTLLMNGDIDRLLSLWQRRALESGDEVIRVIANGMAGRHEEARREVRMMRQGTEISAFRVWADFLEAWLDKSPADMLRHRLSLGPLRVMDDPEAIFQEGSLFCDAGNVERGLSLLRLSVSKGYFVAGTLSRSPMFRGVRNDPAFQEILAAAEAGSTQALKEFRERGGERILGAAAVAV